MVAHGCAKPDVRTVADALEQLGPVNVLAVEEHDETVKRLEFLTTQRTDLTEARNSLAQDVLAHMDHEPEALVVTTTPADDAVLGRVLKRGGIRLHGRGMGDGFLMDGFFFAHVRERWIRWRSASRRVKLVWSGGRAWVIARSAALPGP